jgi:predicted nucleotidyltransferase
MYEKLNITENHLQILELFTKGFNREYYIREVQKLLGISPRTAQLILDDLEKKAVLESVTKGKIKAYKIRKSGIARDFLVFVEQHKKIAFLAEHALIREVFEKITGSINGAGIIFGSYAKGTEKKGSDLDVFVIGSYDEKGISTVSGLYGIQINIKNYPAKIFGKSIRNDPLVREVLDNHVVFKNADEFVRVVLTNG